MAGVLPLTLEDYAGEARRPLTAEHYTGGRLFFPAATRHGDTAPPPPVTHLGQPPHAAADSPKVHDIVLLQPTAAAHARKAFWWKAAALGVLILFGAAAVTAFVLTSLHAPAALPYVSIAIGFLTFSNSFGITRLSKWCESKARECAKEQREDAFVEEKLKEWEALSFDEVVREVAEEDADAILDDLELPSHCGLKTLFARYVYHQEQERKIAPIYFKARDALDPLEADLHAKMRKIHDANSECILDLSTLCAERDQLTLRKQAQEEDLQRALDQLTYARRASALYLYLIRRPFNRIPASSPLTWDRIFLPPVLDDPVNGLPLEQKFHKRLPDGTHLSFNDIRTTSTHELSKQIERAVERHIQETVRREGVASGRALA